ncbi:phosphoenolpyruvate--protein phosphotransferase [Gallaecimonas sp. GXIMD4217]|uniref:phosphoenolpyruvate--protein phosphotransferase n=1 Tax=Gallaecimonas sp. GXIMD4217 TaxID=3131927 RepID=UPI00311B3436
MLTGLQAIVQKVNRAASLNEAMAWLVEATCELFQTEVCSIYLADDEDRVLQLVSTQGLSLPQGEICTLAYGEGLVGLVATREEPLNLGDAQHHPAFKLITGLGEEPFHSFLGVPIIFRRRVLGVLTVQQRQPRVFAAEEEAALMTLASQLAPVLANVEERSRLLEASSGWRRSVKGQPGAPGVAIARAWVRLGSQSLDEITFAQVEDSQAELARFDLAVADTRAQLQALIDSLSSLPAEARAIFELYLQLLAPASLGEPVHQQIRSGVSAEWALKLVLGEAMGRFEAMEDAYLRERGADLRDLGNRLLSVLQGEQAAPAAGDGELVLVADEVTAAMLAEVPRAQLKGILSRRGSGHSHAAILARAMGIPAVMGVGSLPLSLVQGRALILDGYAGRCYFDPEPSLIREFERLVEEEKLLTEALGDMAGPALSLDGEAVTVMLNAGLSADADIASNLGVDGVGLYRTEVPFMLGSRLPGEAEQFRIYRHVLAAYQGKPVTLRTLDIGGDKTLPYMPIEEANPFLGWRGIRITLDQPDVFLIQLRAMLRAHQQLGNLRLMLPMVSSVAEVDEALRLLRQAHHELQEELGQAFELPDVGVMLEVPAILYQLPQLAERVQFVSVGTNDLTQYLLAVDRNNARVAELFDPFHPAVVQVLHQISRQCAELDLELAVCGELAGEVLGLVLLLSLGYRRFSMNTSQVAKAKHLVGKLSLAELAEGRAELLAAADADRLCWLLRERLVAVGLSGWLRGGR